MRIREKVVLISLATVLPLLVILTTLSIVFILKSFRDLEKANVQRDVERVNNAIQAELDKLASTSKDYSAWDDTYQFAQSGDPLYVENNMIDSSLVNLGVDLMIILGPEQEQLAALSIDQDTGEQITMPTDLIEILKSPGSLFNTFNSPLDSFSGFVKTGSGAVMLATSPIVTSNYEGPIRGTFVVGKYLDAAEIESLAEQTQLSLAVEPYDSRSSPQDYLSAQAAIEGGTPIYVSTLENSRIAGYSSLKDTSGQPILILRVDQPRDIYNKGVSSLTYFVIGTLFVVWLAGFINVFLIDTRIIVRLSKLNRDLKIIGEKGNLSARLTSTGKDEIAELSEQINGMLTDLDKSETAVRELERSQILNAIPDFMLIINRQGLYKEARGFKDSALSADTQKFSGSLLGEVSLFGQDTQKILGSVVQALETQQLITFEYQAAAPSGNMIEYEVRIAPLKNEETLVILRDMTESRKSERELKRAHQQLKENVVTLIEYNRASTTLVEFNDISQTCYTPAEIFSLAIKYAEILFPDDSGAIFAFNPETALFEMNGSWGDFYPHHKKIFTNNECGALKNWTPYLQQEPHSTPCTHLLKGSDTAHFCVPLMVQSEVVGLITLASDYSEENGAETINETKQRLAVLLGERIALAIVNLSMQEAIRSQAMTDPETGLYNRRYLDDLIDREIYRSNATNRPFGLLQVSIDHLQGLVAGSEKGKLAQIKREVAGLLRKYTTPADVICIYSGDEFTVLLTDLDAGATLQKANEIEQGANSTKLPFQRMNGHISLSIGAVSYPQNGVIRDALLRAASAALYQARIEKHERAFTIK